MCKVLKDGACKGCKIGYDDGSRELSKAKCKIKVCCMTRQYNSCADCEDYETCGIVQEFYNKNGYKYKKYKQAIDFIRENGYTEYLKIADQWTMQYGKYK